MTETLKAPRVWPQPPYVDGEAVPCHLCGATVFVKRDGTYRERIGPAVEGDVHDCRRLGAKDGGATSPTMDELTTLVEKLIVEAQAVGEFGGVREMIQRDAARTALLTRLAYLLDSLDDERIVNEGRLEVLRAAESRVASLEEALRRPVDESDALAVTDELLGLFNGKLELVRRVLNDLLARRAAALLSPSPELATTPATRGAPITADAVLTIRRIAGLLYGYRDALRHGSQLHANDFGDDPEQLERAAAAIEAVAALKESEVVRAANQYEESLDDDVRSDGIAPDAGLRAMRRALTDFLAARGIVTAPTQHDAPSMDWQRVCEWMRDPARKPANTAFTAGAERQMAYAFEDAASERRDAPWKAHAQSCLMRDWLADGEGRRAPKPECSCERRDEVTDERDVEELRWIADEIETRVARMPHTINRQKLTEVGRRLRRAIGRMTTGQRPSDGGAANG